MNLYLIPSYSGGLSNCRRLEKDPRPKRQEVTLYLQIQEMLPLYSSDISAKITLIY